MLRSHRQLIAAIAMMGLVAALGYTVEQSEFGQIVLYYFPLFGLYLWFCKEAAGERISWSRLMWLAVMLRGVLLFGEPNLSNDYYRFIWDGRLLLAGISPYAWLPSEILSLRSLPPGIDMALFEAFGAKDTYSSYPPLAQVQFYTAVWAFPDSIYGAAIVLKLWQFLFEVGTLRLLPKVLHALALPRHWAVWYALNPLIIVELTGNAHSEAGMLFLFLLAIWLLMANKFIASSASLAASIGVKLLPAMFLPLLLRRLGWKAGTVYAALVGGITVAMFVPLLDVHMLGNFTSSLRLYFERLEFNGSIYYLLRWVGWMVKGYNVIGFLGPALGVVAALGILWLAWRWLPPSPWVVDLKLMEGFFWAICIYLFLTTTLHPWYLSLPLMLSVFTHWRFPVIWSLLIFLTYINYSRFPWQESTVVLFLEYGGVGAFLLLEYLHLRKFRRTHPAQ